MTRPLPTRPNIITATNSPSPALSLVPPKVESHKVRVALTYRNNSPYKWVATCTCGWGTASWSWSRIWDCEQSTANNPTYSRDDWIRDNGAPHGGAFINALEHVGLY